ncbi:MAG TPA: hypothetical protein VNA21_10690, partial [Steroidobacteraceae bacterium]|nr:hypothetical protein [Steroidobacteraceae bacterium]
MQLARQPLLAPMAARRIANAFVLFLLGSCGVILNVCLNMSNTLSAPCGRDGIRTHCVLAPQRAREAPTSTGFGSGSYGKKCPIQREYL